MKISFANYEVELLAEGALWIAQHKLLCVADLHFEKGTAYAPLATLLPPYDSRETLDKLSAVIMRTAPEVVVAAGDSFHDRHAGKRMHFDTLSELNELIGKVSAWYWVTGNHDPDISDNINGMVCEQLENSGITFCHQATDGLAPEISGHFHPKARRNIVGHFISGPCFVQRGHKIILPAFGQYTGGLDIESDAFLRVMPDDERNVFIMAHDSVFRV